jgi:hypothetical protein
MGDKAISLPETILASIFTLLIDGIDILLWLFGIPFIGILIDIPAMLIIHFWLWMKGANYQRALVGSLVETLPIPLDLLPIRTITLWMSIHKTNHPKGDSSEGEEENQNAKVGSPEDYDLAA